MTASYRRLIFRPISMLYFTILLLWLLMLTPLISLFLRAVFVEYLGLPPELFLIVLLLSLLGSFVNIPIAELESPQPVYTYREASFFGVTWYIPQVEMGWRRTVIALNVGGGLVPIIVSLYLLLYAIPQAEPDPLSTYIKILIVLLIVSLIVHKASRVVRGLGIATPAFIPPTITALTTLLIYQVGVPSNPMRIAYIGGTLGTLIGADILNLHRIPRLGAPIVSIGGAGTFDGIYTTGLISVLLILLLL
ncbi:DUF1614 domain-containing protein [Candidatus Bathyarchaeota archaeon]|nr:DUF1614 domain-containing protein [Candidatus Bathyarchaeota archaeon]